MPFVDDHSLQKLTTMLKTIVTSSLVDLSKGSKGLHFFNALIQVPPELGIAILT